MSDTTTIEWTDRTWNPVTGCTKVSAGCDHCYAETMHERFNGRGSFALVTAHPDRFTAPLTWRRPAKVFVNSMSDLFHEDVTDDVIVRVWATMALAPRHTFQVLTKRHGRMRSLLSSGAFRARVADEAYLLAMGERGLSDRTAADAREAYLALGPVFADPSRVARALPWPLPNVWVGVSAEDQRWADIRVPALLSTPAAVRWVSAEPLLGPLSVARYLRGVDGEYDTCGGRALDWLVVGGESGPGARPMDPSWPLALRDECADAGVPYLFKQWGAHDATGKRVGKKAAGRELDGAVHDGYPEVVGV